MKISLPVLFTAPVLCVVVFLSFIAFTEGKNTANDLMAQNLVQIHNHIEERLDDLLNLPNRIQRINASLIVEGWLDLKKLRAWQPTLLEQAQAFKDLSSITWGGSDGNSVGISRYPDEFGYESSIKDEQTGNKLEGYYCDMHGRMEKKPREASMGSAQSTLVLCRDKGRQTDLDRSLRKSLQRQHQQNPGHGIRSAAI